VRKLVKDEPGVIKVRLGRKKAHTIYSVPASAAERIHTLGESALKRVGDSPLGRKVGDAPKYTPARQE